MIRNVSFTKANELYKHIADHNARAFIMAKQNTPISTLVDPVIAPALFYDDVSPDFESVNSITSMLERNAQVPDGTDAYDLSLQNFVSLSSEAIRRTAYLTKSVALPVIEEITIKAEEKLNEVTGGVGLALNILPDTQGNILTNPVLVSAIEPFTSVAGPNTPTINVHAPRDSAQLVELIRVGVEDFDKEIEEWVATHLSSDLLVTIYKRIFSTASLETSMINVFDGEARSYPEALICFLICRGLTVNHDDDINMSSSTYDLGMAMISNYAAMVLKRAKRQLDRSDKNEKVVLRYPRPGEELTYDSPEKGIIVVNQSVYAKFLEEGGSPEVIMGSYLTGRAESKVDLLADREMYVKHYNMRIMKLRSDSRLRAIISMRKTLERLVADEIVLTMDDVGENGLWKGIKIDQVAAQRKLRYAIDRIRLEDLDDMYSAVRNIVLSVFFADTDVPKLIEHIDANSVEGVEMSTVINVALIDYIVDWFMHQTELVIS